LSATARFHRRVAETAEKKNIPETRPGCLHRIPQQRPGSKNRIPETRPGCLHRISVLCAFVGDSSSSCPVGPLDPARPVPTGTATVLPSVRPHDSAPFGRLGVNGASLSTRHGGLPSAPLPSTALRAGRVTSRISNTSPLAPSTPLRAGTASAPQNHPGCLNRIPQQRPGSKRRIPQLLPGRIRRALHVTKLAESDCVFCAFFFGCQKVRATLRSQTVPAKDSGKAR